MANYPLVLSVTSGKGGVGKTNVSVNLACRLAAMGRRVVLLDADLGLANVDVLLGLAPTHTLFHLFHEQTPIEDILLPTEYGFTILPAASGVADMLSLSTGQKLELLEAMDGLEDQVDYLIVDTGAGINDNVLYFNLAVQERLLVVTPEPTSLTDAYAVIKVLKNSHGIDKFRILVNMVPDARTARNVFTTLYKACDHFLDGVSLDMVGYLPMDVEVRRAVIDQIPFSTRTPDSPAARQMAEIARAVNRWQPATRLDGNIKFFWKKILFQEQSVA
ncbi:Cobyrinic acid ac-diamide synthase [Desulfovibrio sp. X2]|uniref:MinD/ParA family protein n=1 Tax=Desulfovibrio sp. X2 TaxID=941449 RepID=UPI000358AB76|nr:MinD/ParA family protein [Desulfovibrio sp. X2]EPR42439.1 Cobyrinic acid ac-diamide synthase [Desulfovibrio sp. X2]